MPLARHLDIRFGEDLLKEVVELAEAKEDDETQHCLLPFDAVLRFDVPSLANRTGLYESPDDQALPSFRLRAFPSRGSPFSSSSFSAA